MAKSGYYKAGMTDRYDLDSGQLPAEKKQQQFRDNPLESIAATTAALLSSDMATVFGSDDITQALHFDFGHLVFQFDSSAKAESFQTALQEAKGKMEGRPGHETFTSICTQIDGAHHVIIPSASRKFFIEEMLGFKPEQRKLLGVIPKREKPPFNHKLRDFAMLMREDRKGKLDDVAVAEEGGKEANRRQVSRDTMDKYNKRFFDLAGREVYSSEFLGDIIEASYGAEARAVLHRLIEESIPESERAVVAKFTHNPLTEGYWTKPLAAVLFAQVAMALGRDINDVDLPDEHAGLSCTPITLEQYAKKRDSLRVKFSADRLAAVDDYFLAMSLPEKLGFQEIDLFADDAPAAAEPDQGNGFCVATLELLLAHRARHIEGDIANWNLDAAGQKWDASLAESIQDYVRHRSTIAGQLGGDRVHALDAAAKTYLQSNPESLAKFLKEFGRANAPFAERVAALSLVFDGPTPAILQNGNEAVSAALNNLLVQFAYERHNVYERDYPGLQTLKAFVPVHLGKDANRVGAFYDGFKRKVSADGKPEVRASEVDILLSHQNAMTLNLSERTDRSEAGDGTRQRDVRKAARTFLAAELGVEREHVSEELVGKMFKAYPLLLPFMGENYKADGAVMHTVLGMSACPIFLGMAEAMQKDPNFYRHRFEREVGNIQRFVGAFVGVLNQERATDNGADALAQLEAALDSSSDGPDSPIKKVMDESQKALLADVVHDVESLYPDNARTFVFKIKLRMMAEKVDVKCPVNWTDEQLSLDAERFKLNFAELSHTCRDALDLSIPVVNAHGASSPSSPASPSVSPRQVEGGWVAARSRGSSAASGGDLSPAAARRPEFLERRDSGAGVIEK